MARLKKVIDAIIGKPEPEEAVEEEVVVDDISKKHTGYNPAFIYE